MHMQKLFIIKLELIGNRFVFQLLSQNYGIINKIYYILKKYYHF